MLVRLLYVSRAVRALGDIDSILLSSRTNNPPIGITGVLCYADGLYLQAIEGGRESVNQLFNKISSDVRHSDVLLLHYEEISERRFGNWTMGQVNLGKVNASILLRYSPLPKLDPYRLSGAISLALLEELMQTACIVGRT
jgi:hypothetical protein